MHNLQNSELANKLDLEVFRANAAAALPPGEYVWTMRYAPDRLHFQDARTPAGNLKTFQSIECCCDYLYDTFLDAEETERLKIKHCRYDGTCDIELDNELIAWCEKAWREE